MGNPSIVKIKRPKTLLMAATNYWCSPFQVGSHHLARGFVKAGWNVIYVSDPISPFHPFNGVNDDFKARFKIYRMNGKQYLNGRIKTFVPLSLLPHQNKPLFKSCFTFQNWHKFTFPNITKQIKKKGVETFDLLYLDSPLQLFWLTKINYKNSVYRIADKNTAFTKATKPIAWAERQIASKVDAILYTAKSLKDYTSSLSPKRSIYFPNGINIKNFSQGPYYLPYDLKNIPKPIAIYVGAMDFWFDFDLINFAANSLPHISFVLIGPKALAEKYLKQLPNIYLLGPKPYKDIPAFLNHADVGIIPFNKNSYPELVNHINPLKLYEYFSCNLSVIAMEWEELKLLKTPAFLCRNHEEFVNKLQNSINLDHGPQILSKKELNCFDWDHKVNELIKTMDL